MPIAAPVPLTSAVPNSTDLDSASQDESGDTGALAGQDSEGYTPRMRQALRHPKVTLLRLIKVMGQPRLAKGLSVRAVHISDIYS